MTKKLLILTSLLISGGLWAETIKTFSCDFMMGENKMTAVFVTDLDGKIAEKFQMKNGELLDAKTNLKLVLAPSQLTITETLNKLLVTYKISRTDLSFERSVSGYIGNMKFNDEQKGKCKIIKNPVSEKLF